ncbi:MAG: HEAT repeat domain-containing protein, partial [bacterium]
MSQGSPIDERPLRWGAARACLLALVLCARAGAGGTDPRVDRQIELLKTGNDWARAVAAGSLGELGDRRAVGPLIKALVDRTVRVRVAAAASLARLGDARAVGPLTRRLDDRA